MPIHIDIYSNSIDSLVGSLYLIHSDTKMMTIGLGGGEAPSYNYKSCLVTQRSYLNPFEIGGK